MTPDDAPAAEDATQPLLVQANLLRELRVSATTLGNTLSSAFARGATEGRRFEDVLRSIGLRLSQSLLKSAFKPLEQGVSGLLSEGLQSVPGGLGGSGGGVGPPMQLMGSVRPFANGGVIGQPTYFGMGRNLGLMGEAGAEAILPLSRGPDGKLGVSAAGQGAAPASITVNIAAADLESFRRSEGQISAAMARAVSRGRRTL
ncbi:MAG: phage tail tape measure protein [Bosea sp.]|nr:phage tail tape measure protein [Bosea sp. (in: a-proteobacteria)]